MKAQSSFKCEILTERFYNTTQTTYLAIKATPFICSFWFVI